MLNHSETEPANRGFSRMIPWPFFFPDLARKIKFLLGCRLSINEEGGSTLLMPFHHNLDSICRLNQHLWDTQLYLSTEKLFLMHFAAPFCDLQHLTHFSDSSWVHFALLLNLYSRYKRSQMALYFLRQRYMCDRGSERKTLTCKEFFLLPLVI